MIFKSMIEYLKREKGISVKDLLFKGSIEDLKTNHHDLQHQLDSIVKIIENLRLDLSNLDREKGNFVGDINPSAEFELIKKRMDLE